MSSFLPSCEVDSSTDLELHTLVGMSVVNGRNITRRHEA
jgi:hypothetical protein